MLLQFVCQKPLDLRQFFFQDVPIPNEYLAEQVLAFLFAEDQREMPRIRKIYFVPEQKRKRHRRICLRKTDRGFLSFAMKEHLMLLWR